MSPLPSADFPEENRDAEWFTRTLHDLRTPLNQIVGLSEMLIESAEEEGDRDLIEGLAATRDAGLEMTNLLHDVRLLTAHSANDGEIWPLTDAVRAAMSRVHGFADLLLSEPTTPRLERYRSDLENIRTAARQFLRIARTSGLAIKLESECHWDKPSRSGGLPENAPLNGRVLIVDDEAVNREVLLRRLQREGCDAVGARSGREALDTLSRDVFDAVLLDIMMPEMSGIEVLHALKKDPQLRHLPVIMLSAIADTDRVARCIELGAEDYLPKPINAVLLRARLGACLEKKRLEDQERAHFRALNAEKERLSVTLRSLTDAVVTTDANGHIVLFNDAAAALTGFSSERATGRQFSEVFQIRLRGSGEPAPDLVGDGLRRCVVTELDPGTAVILSGGGERLISAHAAPIHDEAGAAHGMVVVVRDVTEREKLAEELLRASKLQSIGALAGGLAHDFNNMLTAVLGNLSLIQHGRHLPSELQGCVKEAERGALRAQELTRYLLTFADGGAPLKKAMDVNSLLEETAAFVVRGSSVQCEFAIDPDLRQAEADPHQLAQVISNVVMNAVESMPAGGIIRVAAENLTIQPGTGSHLPSGEYLRITVRDTGSGIAPEHISRVFDPFFTTKAQARGLGLAAAYSIMQRHQGYISVERAQPAGTLVTIHLPALRPAAPAGARPASAHDGDSSEAGWTPAHGPRKQRVLVMDDEEAIRLLAETMLSMLDYEVVAVPDGETALAAHADALAAGRPFDLAVMDLTIPGGMGGIETIRHLREKDTSLRVVVSSGYSNDPVMAHYTEHGFDAVLPKPYVFDDLLAVLKQLTPAVSSAAA